MIDKTRLSQLNAITHDPAWQEIVVRRLGQILESTDKLFHRASKIEDFRYYQGRYEQAKEIYDMFKEPSKLVDDGVSTILPHPAKEA